MSKNNSVCMPIVAVILLATSFSIKSVGPVMGMIQKWYSDIIISQRKRAFVEERSKLACYFINKSSSEATNEIKVKVREKLNCSPDAYSSVLWAGIFLYFGSHHDLGKTVIQEVLQAFVDPSLNMREGYDQVEFAYSDFLVNEYKQSSATIDMLSPEKITDRQYKLFSIFKELRKTEPCMVEGMPEGNVHVQTEMQVQTESQAQKNNNTCVCDKKAPEMTPPPLIRRIQSVLPPCRKLKNRYMNRYRFENEQI